MRRWFLAPIVLVLLVALTGPALAQTSGKSGGRTTSSQSSGIGYQGWGVQVGVSSNPDQIYGGVHWDLGEFARNVRFRPLFEIGRGDHATIIQGMAQVTYIFSKIQVWKPYVGGELGITYVNIDSSSLPPGVDNTDTALALQGVGGIETRLKSGTRFNLELKAGFGDDDPDFKIGAGWTWK